MTPDEWLIWVNRVYFGAGGIAAVATVVTVLAGVAQNRLNDSISLRKDRELTEFRISSDRQIAELHKATAEANQKAEEERLARVKIEERLAPRTLSPTEIEKLSADISGHAGTQLDVWIISEGQETTNIGNVLANVFVRAGFKVQGWMWVGVTVKGVKVYTEDQANPEIQKLADTIASSLSEIGLAATHQPWGGPWTTYNGMLSGPVFQPTASASIRLVVGGKP